MVPRLSPWQRPDGWTSDAYFGAVEEALNAVGIGVCRAERDEDWDYSVVDLAPEQAHRSGCLEVCVLWRTRAPDQLTSAEESGDGWYWMLFRARNPLDDRVEDLPLSHLAEPEQVAQAVAVLLRPRAADGQAEPHA
ncbi:hypothetical protein ACFFMN_38935 [Planobispora siamensis]|uniref:Uncharacterized protein n=1 Tax=Planobispora siamensis TaxID=936338 RepID=A0A8J3WQ29_9ACTN|nr:hypothetical protein [Planobispora siamensis]GIH96362.1 hypothetical protein Psi01_69920 [Planobispora siamensis]